MSDRMADLIAGLDSERLFWVVLAVWGCAALGSITAGAAFDDHRRTYRLSGVMPAARELVGPIASAGIGAVCLLCYFSWRFDWGLRASATPALGLVGGLAFVSAFGAIYRLCAALIDPPEPLSVAYRFTREELEPPRSPAQGAVWRVCLLLSWTMELLEREVFNEWGAMRLFLDLGGDTLFVVALAVGYFLGRPYYRALAEQLESVKRREAAAAAATPVALP